MKEALLITEIKIQGKIPDNFQEGVYVRNGLYVLAPFI
jgi:hypothetical protein